MRNFKDARRAGPVGSCRVEERLWDSQVGRGWMWRVVVKWVKRVSIEGVVGGMVGEGVT